MWTKHQSPARRAGLAALVAALAGGAAIAQDLQGRPGEPPITEQTKRSGGDVGPERAALRLEDATLHLDFQPDKRTIDGRAVLRLTTAIAQDRLLIDLDRNLPVRSIAIDGQALAAGSWSNPQGLLEIRLPRRLPAGATVTADIRYGGTPHVAVRAPWDDGWVWSSAIDKPWFATTAQGYGCDLFWPCLDFPAGEIKRMTMHLTVPAGVSAPANGKLLARTALPDGRTRWSWQARDINPYLIAISVGPYGEITDSYQSRFGNRFPMYFWHRADRAEQARGLFAEFAPTLDFFEQVVGPFPFADEKMGVVETPYLGMEHQTINAYGNEYRKDETGFDWLFQHELAHEWFGNQMTAADWDDFWLHEGYGNYMQPVYGEHREGEARYIRMMREQRVHVRNCAPIVSGRSRTSNDVYEESLGGPGQDIYYKGAWMLHSLRWKIGDERFWDVTRRIVYGRPDPKPGNFTTRFATTAEYERIVEQVTGSDHQWFFDVYLRQAKLPVLDVQRAGGRLTLAWQAPNGAPFPMPVEVSVDGKVQRVEMPGGRATLPVAEGATVRIDPRSRLLKHEPALPAQAPCGGAGI